MEKISPPLRIALVAVMLLAVAWFVVLRPKPPADEPATPPPGVAGLSNDVQRAQSATATANTAAAAAQNAAANVDRSEGAAPTASAGAATKTTTKTATATTSKGTTVTATTKKTTKAVATKPAATKPAASPKEQPTVAARPKAKAPATPKVAADPAAPLVAALRQNKAVVLLFRSRSSDSQAVADAVRAVPKQVKRVVVRVAPIGQVGRYATFTEKTQISQAPTVLVIGPGRRAKVIVGYTSTAEVAEAVGDLRRAARR